jgi:protein-S-isoprenylcysteine O-methyltransferase Ste14
VILFLKNLVFVLAVPGTIAGYVPWRITRGDPIGAPGYVAAAAVLALLGGALYLWCVWNFALIGRGTPAPIDPPRKLVVRGPYRYVRNPMYVCVLAAILAWAVLFRSLPVGLYACGVGAIFHLFVVLYEEPHLRKAFGAEYEDYCARVGRWLPSRRGGRPPQAAA